MSGRGRGSCPSCHEEYFNRSKPPKCPKCGYFLGGTFYGPRKKVKSASPTLVEINTGVFSCRTAGYDRCFVTSRGGLWLCTRFYVVFLRSNTANSNQIYDQYGIMWAQGAEESNLRKLRRCSNRRT